VSVINKMLRDLDRRQAAGPSMGQMPLPRAGGARDTLSLGALTGTQRRAGWRRLGVLLTALVALGGAAGWWYLNQSNAVPSKVSPATIMAPVLAPLVQSKTVMGEPLAPLAKPPVPEPNVWASMSLKMDSTFKRVSSPAALAKPDLAGSARLVPERVPNERPVAAASASPAAAVVPPQSSPRQAPAMEALAQAQTLWKAGSHEAAMDLLHEALASTERAHLAGLPAGNNAMLAALARELARMELAEGRVSQTLAMLTRLEPALSGFADVWAIRGNAAQRLGRHQESAAAYVMALKLRPDEPRWMLGAAVSLAAQGQMAGAAELAEKARAGGVLSAEVATYLRQLGVVLHER
jgi:MSHA biogenesis protein MshN